MTYQTRRTLHKRTAVKTVAFYALFACLWIYFSDSVLVLFIQDSRLLSKAQTVKGLLFVVVTATILYLYLSHCLNSLRKREEELDQELARTAQEAEERLEQLSTLFDSMNALVYVADIENYDLLFVNRYATEHFGPDWHNAKCYHYLQSGMDRPCDFCTNPLLVKNGEPGEPIAWEFLNTKNSRWYSCFDKAIRWTDGRLARLEVAFDVTERKELEEIKDDLLSSMSHEMRTPLTAISGFTELLMNDSELSEAHQKQVGIIFHETERLTELVNKFLDVRRLKIDRSRINYEPLGIAELLHKAKKDCRHCKEQHNILIQCNENVFVTGNKNELLQVFKQILDNACLYSPKGGEISILAEPRDGYIFIAFKDHGIGIPERELEAIFQPFHRLDRGDTRSTSGIGLGLSVAREIVALHGGEIHVESTVGQGSLFTIQLPCA